MSKLLRCAHAIVFTVVVASCSSNPKPTNATPKTDETTPETRAPAPTAGGDANQAPNSTTPAESRPAKEPASSSTTPPASPTSGATRPAKIGGPATLIRPIGANRFETARADLTGLLDAAQGRRIAAIVPGVRMGKPHGVKIYAVRKGSLYAQLGIRNGDSLLTVNGAQVASLGFDERQFQDSLRSMGQIVLGLWRRGAPVTVTIIVHD